MTTTQATNGSSSTQMYGTKSGSSQKSTNVTDVFFGDALNTEIQNKQSSYENSYKSSKDVSVNERQKPEAVKTEKSEPNRPEKQDESKPVDNTEKTDDKPKVEEEKTDKVEANDAGSEKEAKTDEGKSDEDTALDALAGQPESLTNQQQAAAAMAALNVEAEIVVTTDDQDIDLELDIETDIETKKQENTLLPGTEKDSDKAGNDAVKQNQNKEIENTKLVAAADADKVAEQKSDKTVDVKVDDQAVTVEDTDQQEEFDVIEKKQEAAPEVKAEQQQTETKEEVAVDAKAEEVKVESSKDKKIDFKAVKHDDYTSQENMSQQNSDFAGMNEKNESRDKGFDRGDNYSKISFISNSSDEHKNIQQTLGLDKANEKMDIDVSKNVDNIVKTVKTMVSNNNSTMVIRLDPPELGEMRINIRTGSDGMSIEIQAANAKSQQMLQQGSSQLRSALENSGIHVNNVDVQFKPDMKNNANAGSDFQDDQSNLFNQDNSQNMPDNGQNQDESFHHNFNNWSDGAEFEDAEFATAELVEAAQSNSEQWQEISFDAVNVLI